MTGEHKVLRVKKGTDKYKYMVGH